jgi:hypothetical protein
MPKIGRGQQIVEYFERKNPVSDLKSLRVHPGENSQSFIRNKNGLLFIPATAKKIGITKISKKGNQEKHYLSFGWLKQI